MRALAKLWNELVIHSPTEYIYILNDDLSFSNPLVFDKINDFIKKTKLGFFDAPHGFSHFVVSKTELDKLGYFDERLLGVGEEDGDMRYRYIDMYGHDIETLKIKNLMPISSE